MEQAVKKYQSIFPKKKDYSYLKQAILGLKQKSNIWKKFSQKITFSQLCALIYAQLYIYVWC